MIKGLILLVDLIGKVGEFLDLDIVMFIKEVLWEGLLNFFLFVVVVNYSLNICCCDMFKIELDDNYKVLCNNKYFIGSEFFGDDFIEWFKIVIESNKVVK